MAGRCIELALVLGFCTILAVPIVGSSGTNPGGHRAVPTAAAPVPPLYPPHLNAGVRATPMVPPARSVSAVPSFDIPTGNRSLRPASLPLENTTHPDPVAQDPTGAAPAAGLATVATLDLLNGSLSPGVVVPRRSFSPESVAYDPQTGLIYVSSGTDIVLEVSPSHFTVVGSFNATARVGSLIYDPLDHLLFGESDGNVSVLDPAGGSFLYSIAAPDANSGTDGTIVLDQDQGTLWVTNPFASNASVVSIASRTLVAHPHVGWGFNDILGGVWDPVNDRIYLVYYENDSVEVYNGSTNGLLANISLSAFCCFAWGLGVDAATGNVFVTQGLVGFEADLIELSNSSYKWVGSVGIGGFPSGSTYDPASGYLYVADAYRSRVTIVDPTNLSIIGRATLAQENPLLAGQNQPLDIPSLGEIVVAMPYGSTVDGVAAAAPFTTSTLDLSGYPRNALYDPACGCLAILDGGRDTLQFVNPASFSLQATIGLAGAPDSMAFDTATDELWVTLGGLFSPSGVEVLNGSTGTELAYLPGGAAPSGIAYDPSNQEIFVAQAFGTNLTIYSGTNRSKVGTIAVGLYPQDVVFDRALNELFVTVGGAGNLTALNATTGAVVGHSRMGGFPSTLALDPATGELVVTSAALDPELVNASTLTNVSALPVPGAAGFALGPDPRDLTILNGSTSIFTVNLSTLNVTSLSVGVASYSGDWLPNGAFVAVDGADAAAYLVTTHPPVLMSNLTVVLTPSMTAPGTRVTIGVSFGGGVAPFTTRYTGLPYGCAGSNATAITCVPRAAGRYSITAFVVNATGVIESASATLFVVLGFSDTVKEIGLPSGTNWTIVMDDGVTAAGAGSSLTVETSNGTHAVVAEATGFEAAPLEIESDVSGANVSQVVRFLPLHLLTFAESGLPFATPWSLTVAGSGIPLSTAALVLSVPDGTYGFAVGYVPQYGPTPAGGSVVVSGTDRTVRIQFTANAYTVTFEEVGLPSGTVWGGSLAPGGASWSTTAHEANLSVQNGSYAWNVTSTSGEIAIPSHGSITVAGRPLTVGIGFTAPPARYQVEFNARGFAVGVGWNVTIASTTLALFGDGNASTNLTNGTYPYVVHAPPRYRAVPSSGEVTVAGANVSLPIVFSKTLYTVDFSAIGLPAGKAWTVSVGGTTVTSRNTSISTSLPAGTFNYLVTGPSGFRVGGIPPAGSVVVTNANITEHLLFQRGGTGAVRVTAGGLPRGATWCAEVGGEESCTGRSSMVFRNLTPGNYSYALVSPLVNQTVRATLGGQIVPSSGTLTAAPRATTLSLKFVYRYPVLFDEVGLPLGELWSVRLAGTTVGSYGVGLVFAEPNGTYSFRVTPVFGYRASASVTRPAVHGGAVMVIITFRVTPGAAPVGVHALPPTARTPVPMAEAPKRWAAFGRAVR